MDLIKIKNICCEKDRVKKKRRQITDWERMFANHILNKALVFRTHEELQKLNIKKSDLKWAELEEIFRWRRYADGSNVHGADTHMENVQHS